MEKVVFANSYEAVFAGLGLKSFDDFFGYAHGKTINKNNKREVMRIALQIEDSNKVFYIKRFNKPHFKDMLFTLTNFGGICSQAACEYKNTIILLRNGIETYRPACFGEQSKFGIEQRSFFITEELKSQCFTDFLAEKWSRLPLDEKEKIVTAIAKTIRKAHAVSISLTDLYVWHLFISQTRAGQYDFAVIDLHRMKHNVKSADQLLENLGRLHHSMTDKYFDASLRRLLITSYAGDNWPSDLNTLIAKVEKLSKKVSAKRNPKPY